MSTWRFYRFLLLSEFDCQRSTINQNKNNEDIEIEIDSREIHIIITLVPNFDFNNYKVDIYCAWSVFDKSSRFVGEKTKKKISYQSQVVINKIPLDAFI